MKKYDKSRRSNASTMTAAELAIRDAMTAVKALPAADERLIRAATFLERAKEAVADYVDDVDFLQRFAEHQAGRDRAEEWRHYVANTAVRLTDTEDKTVREWPLAFLPGFPQETPYAVEWSGRFFRMGAQTSVGIIEGATHGKEYEIVFHEVTAEDPLRDYEREAVPFKLSS